jgi:aldehyde dehydrogenase (NAD+)
VRWRTEQLRGLQRLLVEQEDAIVEALASDLGRPPPEAWLGDIASTQAEVAYALKHLKKWMRRRRASVSAHPNCPPEHGVQYEPLGVVLVIGPWKLPGVPESGSARRRVWQPKLCGRQTVGVGAGDVGAAGTLLPRYLDPRAVRVVEGDATTTQELLAQGFDHAFFTGGTEIGRKIMAAAAPTLTPVTLELGGKGPVIVAADADLDVAARRIAWVKLMNSGQTCIAPDYVLAEHTIAPVLTENIHRQPRAISIRGIRSATPDRQPPSVRSTDVTHRSNRWRNPLWRYVQR